ncbi:MAG: hypothetical protein GY796_15905 [Chloroflexi bacterium]|nr:hypothetical protein [Chloroflexota bacterium]
MEGYKIGKIQMSHTKHDTGAYVTALDASATEQQAFASPRVIDLLKTLLKANSLELRDGQIVQFKVYADDELLVEELMPLDKGY